jgi:S1-C subfamily serine protease
VDDEQVTSMANLRKILYNYRIGDSAQLTIDRGGEILYVTVRFREF